MHKSITLTPSNCSPMGLTSWNILWAFVLWTESTLKMESNRAILLSSVSWDCVCITSTNLTHSSRVTHICINKLTIIGSDNDLSPDRRQAIIWTNAGILLIGPLGTNFSEILMEILTFSFKKMHLKVSSAKRRPFCLGLNVLRLIYKIQRKS